MLSKKVWLAGALALSVLAGAAPNAMADRRNDDRYDHRYDNRRDDDRYDHRYDNRRDDRYRDNRHYDDRRYDHRYDDRYRHDRYDDRYDRRDNANRTIGAAVIGAVIGSILAR